MTDIDLAFEPDWVSPPGDTILDLMEERDWSQAELSERLGFSRKHLNQLVKGKVALTEDAALKLERVFGAPASFWGNREAQYRQQLASIEAEKRYESWIEWLDRLPLADLKKVGVIPDKRIAPKDKPGLVKAMLQFFGVASPEEWCSFYEGMEPCFRRTKAEQSDTGAIASWLRLGEMEAERTTTPKYNRSVFQKSLVKIRELTTLQPNEFEPELRRLCTESGVKFVLVEKIPRAHVSGVARWLNGHSPLIQMSLYGKTNDKFWFTFFHEAAHILLHSSEKREIFLDDSPGREISREEDEANEWAANILIPPAHRFELGDLRGKEEIVEFSRSINLHAGIVVGRLQFDRLISYATPLNSLKQKFRLAPRA